MSVNSHLINLANAAIVRDRERESIQRSIITMNLRLSNYFPSEIADQFVFGSYDRGTILTRSMDVSSDVDYMVVFSDSSYRPQTYLDRLRRFTELKYARSEISQSHPTMVLELNHIRVELVPAVKDWFGNIRIPGKASDYQDWIDTDPKGFNDRLVAANKSNNNLIKPLVRLVKYWNGVAGYPFESYELEQKVVSNGFFLRSLIGGQLKDYFYDFVNDLSISMFAAQWKRNAVDRLKTITSTAKALEIQNYAALAEVEIFKILPPLT